MSEIVRLVGGRARVFRGVGRRDSAALGIIEGVLKCRFATSAGSTRDAVRAAAVDAFGDRQLDEILHLLGGFVGVEFPESPFLKAFEGESRERHHMGRVVLRRFFEADARRFGPTILILEDLHHAPADTLDLVQSLVSTLSSTPILILGTCRPALLARRPGWGVENRERHALVELPPLSVEDARRLIVALLGIPGPVPPVLVDAAVRVAGGSPYLLEQVIPAFAEAGVLTPLAGGGVSVNEHLLDAAKLPLSVDDATATRIASLGGDARQLLEMAATMGSVFWFGALVALRRLSSETPELWGGVASATDHIRDTLDGLATRNYVVPLPTSSIPGEVEYAFKHNVEREAVLEQLPATQAVSFHRVVGEWLEFRLAERAEEHCELLARHFEEAGLGLKAAVYTLRAADRARARFANAKSAEHYARGLELLGDADRLVRLDALHHFGDVLQARRSERRSPRRVSRNARHRLPARSSRQGRCCPQSHRPPLPSRRAPGRSHATLGYRLRFVRGRGRRPRRGVEPRRRRQKCTGCEAPTATPNASCAQPSNDVRS